MSGILVMRLRGLGDIVHLLPVLKMLREQMPDEQIGLFVQKPFGELIPDDLNITLIEMLPGAGFAQLLELSRQIRKYKFDAVYDLFSNPATAIVSLLSGIKKRYGFNYRVRKYAYTKTFTPADPNIRLSELFLQFFEYFGIHGTLKEPEISFSEKVNNKALEAVPDGFDKISPLLAVNPNATYDSKAWPVEYFAELIGLWFVEYHRPVLVTWGPGENGQAENLLKRVGPEKAFTHKSVNISEFAALLKRADLFLTADTGPMNIAWAVSVPVVALFGPTTREPVYPRGEKHLTLYNKDLDCLECHKNHCQHKKCMVSLTPQIVFEAIRSKYGARLSDLAAQKTFPEAE